MVGESWLLENLRQEVSGMLITHWNEATQALPVLVIWTTGLTAEPCAVILIPHSQNYINIVNAQAHPLRLITHDYL